MAASEWGSYLYDVPALAKTRSYASRLLEQVRSLCMG